MSDTVHALRRHCGTKQPPHPSASPTKLGNQSIYGSELHVIGMPERSHSRARSHRGPLFTRGRVTHAAPQPRRRNLLYSAAALQFQTNPMRPENRESVRTPLPNKPNPAQKAATSPRHTIGAPPQNKPNPRQAASHLARYIIPRLLASSTPGSCLLQNKPNFAATYTKQTPSLSSRVAQALPPVHVLKAGRSPSSQPQSTPVYRWCATAKQTRFAPGRPAPCAIRHSSTPDFLDSWLLPSTKQTQFARRNQTNPTRPPHRSN
jgi:hypothetical protein